MVLKVIGVVDVKALETSKLKKGATFSFVSEKLAKFSIDRVEFSPLLMREPTFNTCSCNELARLFLGVGDPTKGSKYKQ